MIGSIDIVMGEVDRQVAIVFKGAHGFTVCAFLVSLSA